MQRWQHESKRQKTSEDDRCTAVLTLTSKEQLPAAMAVLALLYGVNQPLSELSDVQLVHAAVLADMLQLKVVERPVMTKLSAKSYCWATNEGLSEAARTLLLQLPAWPAAFLEYFNALTRRMTLQEAVAIWLRECVPAGAPRDLKSLLDSKHGLSMQRRLETEFSDLEQAMLKKDAKNNLWALPLPAIQLLLGSPNLRVREPVRTVVLVRRSAKLCYHQWFSRLHLHRTVLTGSLSPEGVFVV